MVDKSSQTTAAAVHPLHIIHGINAGSPPDCITAESRHADTSTAYPSTYPDSPSIQTTTKYSKMWD